MSALTTLTSGLLGISTAAASGSDSEPWRSYIFSPATRQPAPVAVHSTAGDVSVTEFGRHHWVLKMAAGSRVSMDFGVEVGGHVSFDVESVSAAPLSLAFAESPSFVRNISDDTGATPSMNWDQALLVSLTGGDRSSSVHYQTPKESFRGGFRFLTFNALAEVTVSNIVCEIGFAPNMPDLRAGSGYFYAADHHASSLNRIWYAGAYTTQTNIAPNNTGRYLPQVRPGWAYNATLGVASPSLVDGAKRDRAIWPGDMGISSVVAMMALGKYGREAVGNSIQTLFYYQDPQTGLLPYAGPDTASFQSGTKSDTYHAWGLITIYEYAMYSGDQEWLTDNWAKIALAVEYIVTGINPDVGLQNQTNTGDWARADTGGYNSALNALGYSVLQSFAGLSGNQTQTASWRKVAARLKRQYNALLWDAERKLYRDNPNSTLYPQDGNSMALLYGLPESPTQSKAISKSLERNWNSIGPVTPELNDTISPFVSSIELLAHLQSAEEPRRALKLLRRLWGYIVDGAPRLMTGSTIVEGITANGSLYYRSESGYDYDAAYTSLSHGWGTGPTAALVNGVLGLRITGLGGKSWELKPQLGDLTSVRAGFDTGLGWFEAVVTMRDDILHVEYTAPEGAKGRVVIPNGIESVTINGKSYDRQSVVQIG